MKRILIMALMFAMVACGEDDSGGRDYRHDFSTGTYEVTDIRIDGGNPDSSSTYLLKFSIDRNADRLVLLEATALYASGVLVEREFEYKADQWNYQYSRWDQDFDSCEETAGDTITCTDREDRRVLTYTITKLNSNFDSSLDLLGAAPNGTVTIDGSNNDGAYGIVEYDGNTCHVEGELYLTGNNARYDLDLERGCPVVGEFERWNPVTVGSWNGGLLTITVDGMPLKFKKFSDLP